MTDHFAYIDDYISGRLSAEDRLAFEAEMLADNALRQAVEDYDVAELVLDGLLEQDLRAVVTGVQVHQATRSGRNRSTGKLVYIALTIVVVIALSLIIFNRPGTTTPAAPYAYVSAVKPISKGDSSQDAIQSAFYYYNQDTTATISALTPLNTVESTYWLTEIAADQGRWLEVIGQAPAIDSLPAVKRDRLIYVLCYAYQSIDQQERSDSLINLYSDIIDPYYLDRLSSPKQQ